MCKVDIGVFLALKKVILSKLFSDFQNGLMSIGFRSQFVICHNHLYAILGSFRESGNAVFNLVLFIFKLGDSIFPAYVLEYTVQIWTESKKQPVVYLNLTILINY